MERRSISTACSRARSAGAIRASFASKEERKESVVSIALCMRWSTNSAGGAKPTRCQNLASLSNSRCRGLRAMARACRVRTTRKVSKDLAVNPDASKEYWAEVTTVARHSDNLLCMFRALCAIKVGLSRLKAARQA